MFSGEFTEGEQDSIMLNQITMIIRSYGCQISRFLRELPYFKPFLTSPVWNHYGRLFFPYFDFFELCCMI